MLRSSPRHVLIAATIAVLLPSLAACDKLKSGKGDGGAGAGSGGGVLSFFSSDFEGEITTNVTSKTRGKSLPQQITFGIKKPKYRIDTSAVADTPQLSQGGAFIIDPPQKKGYVLIHPQKMAIVLDFEKMKGTKGQGIPGLGGGSRGGGTPSTPPTPPKIEKTGKKDNVAGYACDVWNVTSEGKKVELCMAEGITWIDVTDLGLSSPEFAIAAMATDANHFPLRVIAFDAKGVEETRMEATKIEKKKLDDARFTVPPDYRVVDPSAMMQGLGGVPGAPSGLPSFPRK